MYAYSMKYGAEIFIIKYQNCFSTTTTASPCQQKVTTPSPCPYATTDHPDIAEWKRTQHENSKGMSHRNSRPSYQALGSFQNDRNQVPADQNKVTETKVSFEFLVQNIILYIIHNI